MTFRVPTIVMTVPSLFSLVANLVLVVGTIRMMTSDIALSNLHSCPNFLVLFSTFFYQ
jgi:hypothetical protein